MINPSSNESSQSFSFLRESARRYFVKIGERLMRFHSGPIHERIGHLEGALEDLHYAQAVYQKMKYRCIERMQHLSREIQAEIQKEPEKNIQSYRHFEQLINRLNHLSTLQSNETDKSKAMHRWILGHYESIRKIKEHTKSYLLSYQAKKKQQMQRYHEQMMAKAANQYGRSA